MLTAYLDESGTHKNQDKTMPILAVGGFISDVFSWMAFEKDWRKLLKKHKLPFFHASSCENGYKIFKHIKDKNERITIRSEFYNIIRQNVLGSFSCSVLVEDYEKVKQELNVDLYGNAYSFAARNCFEFACTIALDTGIEKVKYILENGAKGKGFILDLYNNDKKQNSNEYCFKSLAFAEKKDVVQLQAADSLVYEMRKRTINYLTPTYKKIVRNALSELLPEVDLVRNIHFAYRYNELKKFVRLQ